MASEGVKDWDLPLPTSSDTSEEEEENEEIDTLQYYIQRMAYRPIDPPKAKPEIEELAKPLPQSYITTNELYHDILEPKERAARVKRLANQYAPITAERMEEIVREMRLKKKRDECLEYKKHALYYNMINKLERQCRTQYLHFLIKKFADFIANIATTIEIPKQLSEPYGRIQRGIFCNIVKLIGIKPKSPMAFYYNTAEAAEYRVVHNLSHAFLGLIIKALDASVKKNPDDLANMECEPDVAEMDNYIKERLMCAAAKKLKGTRKSTRPLCDVYADCEKYARCNILE